MFSRNVGVRGITSGVGHEQRLSPAVLHDSGLARTVCFLRDSVETCDSSIGDAYVDGYESYTAVSESEELFPLSEAQPSTIIQSGW